MAEMLLVLVNGTGMQKAYFFLLYLRAQKGSPTSTADPNQEPLSMAWRLSWRGISRISPAFNHAIPGQDQS